MSKRLKPLLRNWKNFKGRLSRHKYNSGDIMGRLDLGGIVFKKEFSCPLIFIQPL